MDLLIIEDNPVIGAALSKGFSELGHRCVWVHDGDNGLEQGRSLQFDAIVLDIRLPVRTGIDILRELRRIGIRTPVILLTALGSVDERVAGLNAGADDYLVKPFAFAELMARIEAVHRRSHDRPATVVKAGGIVLDLAARRITHNEVEIELTPTEFGLLEYLMRFAGQVVTRKMLCEHLWKSDWEGTTNLIEVHVNRLRGKLARITDETIVQTIPGRGYAFRVP